MKKVSITTFSILLILLAGETARAAQMNHILINAVAVTAVIIVLAVSVVAFLVYKSKKSDGSKKK
jgi:heme/copper-type cytochrome/quinol oxidase subunit 2